MVERRGASAVSRIAPVKPADAEGLVATVYDQLRRDFLVGPALTLHSPQPEVLAAVSCLACETLVAGRVERGLKELVATGISEINQCPYCVQAHTSSAEAAYGPAVVRAIVSGTTVGSVDEKASAVLQWARAGLSPGHAALQAPPFSREQAPEFIGTALAFHYINRMVSIFCDDSPFPVPRVLSRFSSLMRKVAMPLFARVVSRSPQPGSWLRLLPEAGEPVVCQWAAGNPTIAAAVAGMVATVDKHAEATVPGQVRELVRKVVSDWRGEQVELSKRWVERHLGDLPTQFHAAARLALLTALAAYQVESDDVDAYRASGADDAEIITLTSWASLQAALRVTEWLAT